jgi:hypothetical protein
MNEASSLSFAGILAFMCGGYAPVNLSAVSI